MCDLKMILVQTSLIWEDKQANKSQISRLIDNCNDVDVILLPEMFTTGFTMNTKAVAETMNGDTVCWMKKISAEHKAILAGSIIIAEEINGTTCYFNRFLWITPEGTIQFYNKRHLFRMVDEDKYFSEGKEKIIVTVNNWRCCLQVCYDLRFPVWSRNRNDYDVLIYVANWPEVRQTAWNVLLQARAHENQCYVIGINRVGIDGNDIPYSGNSAVIDPKGRCIGKLPPGDTGLIYATLSANELHSYKKKFPANLDADAFTVKN